MGAKNKFFYDAHLDSILKGVSRSFYLTLRFLPAEIRPQISVAYLIARATDTVADTNIITTENRVQTLRFIRDSIMTESFDAEKFSSPLLNKTFNADFSSEERALIENFGKVLFVYKNFLSEDKKLIKKVIFDITTGQELDLLRFSNAGADNIVCLNDDNDLDDYTFYVAGTVGDFWTRMCFLHVIQDSRLSLDEMVNLGVRYGKGLQLINILRDLPFDLRKGRCYLPNCSLKKHGFSPNDLLDVRNEEKFRGIYNQYLKLTCEHLKCGREYIFNIPLRYFRLRFVTALPLLIGIKTVEKMYYGKILDPTQKIKISRSLIKKLIALCICYYPLPFLWKRLFESEIFSDSVDLVRPCKCN